MIQVCSTCGTRWNVRDRRRDWCPRCNGTLLAPTGPDPATLGTPPSGRGWRPAAGLGTPPSGSAGRTPPRLPPGYRWIAVRPGAAPPPRRDRRPLGPTPRYAFIPRWGLVDRFDQTDHEQVQTRSGPSARDGAGHADRDHGGVRYRGIPAPRALRASHHQPWQPVEPVGGRWLRRGSVWPPASSRSSRSSPARSC